MDVVTAIVVHYDKWYLMNCVPRAEPEVRSWIAIYANYIEIEDRKTNVLSRAAFLCHGQIYGHIPRKFSTLTQCIGTKDMRLRTKLKCRFQSCGSIDRYAF